jgi:ABC-type transporter MlaC component
MEAMGDYARDRFGLTPEQVQIFTPTPGTWSTVMYATGIDPFTNQPVHVERDTLRRRAQKEAVGGRSGRGAGPGVRRPFRSMAPANGRPQTGNSRSRR